MGGGHALHVEVVALDSHKADKYSRHLVLKPFLVPKGTGGGGGGGGGGGSGGLRVPLALKGSASAKQLACRTAARLGSQLRVEAPGATSSVAAAAAATVAAASAADDAAAGSGSGGGSGGGGGALFVDLGVYTRSRCFRLVGSSKLSSAARLRVSDGACEGLPSALSRLPLAQQLEATLVVPMLPMPHAPHAKAWLTLEIPPDARTTTLPAAAAPVGRQPGPTAAAGAAGGAIGRLAAPGDASAAAGDARRHGDGDGDGGGDGGDGGVSNNGGGGDGGGEQPTPADLAEAWLAQWDGVTDSPLLDVPPSIGPKHPFVRSFCSGGGSPPGVLAALGAWAVTEFGRWAARLGGGGGSGAACSIRKWHYVRSEHPNERLLHLTAHGTRYCFARGRQHASQHVMLSLDLIAGIAYQRCWDAVDCVEVVRGGVTLKCKHRLGRPPVAALPTLADLDAFEAQYDPAPREVD